MVLPYLFLYIWMDIYGWFVLCEINLIFIINVLCKYVVLFTWDMGVLPCIKMYELVSEKGTNSYTSTFLADTCVTPADNRKELSYSKRAPHLYTIHTHHTEIMVCLIQFYCDLLFVVFSVDPLVWGGHKGQLAPREPWLKGSIMVYRRLSTSLG